MKVRDNLSMALYPCRDLTIKGYDIQIGIMLDGKKEYGYLEFRTYDPEGFGVIDETRGHKLFTASDVLFIMKQCILFSEYLGLKGIVYTPGCEKRGRIYEKVALKAGYEVTRDEKRGFLNVHLPGEESNPDWDYAEDLTALVYDNWEIQMETNGDHPLVGIQDLPEEQFELFGMLYERMMTGL